MKLGNANPFCTIGWSNSVEIGQFTISAALRSSLGGVVLNQMKAVYENITEFGQKNVLASWLDEPEYTGKNAYSSKYIEDASYLKLDNLTVTYNVPVPKTSLVKNCSVYLSGQNLFVLTGYSGVDPEVSLSGLAPGIEGLSYYPRTRSFTFGVNVKF